MQVTSKDSDQMGMCPGWSEALLVAHTTLLEISCGGLNIVCFLICWKKKSVLNYNKHSRCNRQKTFLGQNLVGRIWANSYMAWYNGQPLKRQSRLRQTTNFATPFPIFRKNKEWYFISYIICYFWKSGKIWNCHLLQIIGGALWVKVFNIYCITSIIYAVDKKNRY